MMFFARRVICVQFWAGTARLLATATQGILSVSSRSGHSTYNFLLGILRSNQRTNLNPASSGIIPASSGISESQHQQRSVYSANIPKRLRAQLSCLQLLITNIWDELDNTLFSVAWMMSREDDRKNHILNGMKEACEYTPWGQDARALCPDITISAMMKGEGRGFTNLVKGYAGVVKQPGPSHSYFLWNEWQLRAVESSEPWPNDVASAFHLLTMHRNQFVGKSRLDVFTANDDSATQLPLNYTLWCPSCVIRSTLPAHSPN